MGGTDALLESKNLLVRECVCLCNHRNQVDLGVQSAHDLDVQRLQGVTCGLDKVDASVDAVVNNVHAVDLVLGVQICVKTLLNVLDNGAPRLGVVDKVSKARGVDDRQSQADSILFNVGTDGLNRHGAGCKVETGLLGFLWRIERCVEKGVDERRLSEAGFT